MNLYHDDMAGVPAPSDFELEAADRRNREKRSKTKRRNEMTEEKTLTIMQPQAVMPIMSIQNAVTRHKQMVGFVREIMRKGTDYGVVPGTSKPTLLKPGAEKLTTFFGLVPRFVPVKVIENFGDDGNEALFYYRYKCELYRNGVLVGEADGSCSSREGKYRWRWVTGEELSKGADLSTLRQRGGHISEFAFAVDKGETSGKYGKPEAYWQLFKDKIKNGNAEQIKKKTAKGAEYDAWEIEAYYYRMPNEDIASVANTVLKMAQKRALVAAMLITVNASEFFTQDMEDIAYGDVIDMASQARAPQTVEEPFDDYEHDGDQKLTQLENERPHWIDCVSKEGRPIRAAFWAWARELTLSGDDVHEALEVESVRDYAGTMDEAKAAILAYIDRKISEADDKETAQGPPLEELEF